MSSQASCAAKATRLRVETQSLECDGFQSSACNGFDGATLCIQVCVDAQGPWHEFCLGPECEIENAKCSDFTQSEKHECPE
jgi:hypothetical protein